MGEDRVLYEPKDLKDIFVELNGFRDFILIPIFDRIASGFFDDLNHNYSKYNLNDGKPVERHGEGLMGYVSPSYNLVMDGKIITMTLRETDIDVEDDDEMWWMTEAIIFEGRKEQIGKMLQNVKNFSKQQKLEELVRGAIQELKKGKMYHLSKEMYNFYFEYPLTQSVPQG